MSRRVGPALSEWERERIIKLWEAGRDPGEIAEIMDTTTITVNKWIRRGNVFTRPRPRSSFGNNWTPGHVVERILELHKEGMNYNRIANEVTPLRYPEGNRRVCWGTVRDVIRRNNG
jgi:intein-encoded DNA endonuclease-like protein